MYSGYTITATALRAKSSFSYAPLPFFADGRREDSASCAQSCLHGFSVNTRYLLYGYWSRQSALIYWSPSRSFLARQVAARCRLSALRDLGLGPSCRRSSDEKCREMIGLLTEVRSCCYRESYGAGKSRNEDGCDKVGSLVKNLKREVEIESVDGESRWPSRARKDGLSSARYSESSLDWHSGSERKEGKGRRTADESSRESGSGRGDVAEREVREVRRYKDDAGSKRRYVSECDAGRDSVKESVCREKDGNLKASSSRKVSEWEIRDREVKAASSWSSPRETREDYGYEEQNIARQEGYRRFTRMPEVGEDDARRGLSSKNMAVSRKVSREDGSNSNGKWRGKADQRVVGRAGWKLEDKEEKGALWMDRREKGDLSIDLAHEAREEYGFEDELIVRKRESREGSWKVTGTSDAYEDDAKRASSSKNMVDDRRAGWEVSSTSNKHTDLGQREVGHTELERRSQKSWQMTAVHDSNIESDSNSHRHYEEMRVRDREDRYALAQHLVHASKDKRSQMDGQVVGTMESNKHHESCGNVSRVHTGDAERASSSQRLLEARKDDREDYSASAMNLVREAWDPWNPITHQSSSRRESERNTQVFEVSRSDTERIFNSQEIYNAGIENEHVNCQYCSRRESGKETNISGKETNISESSRNDIERVSNSQETSNTSVEHLRGKSSLTLVQDKIEKQRSNLSGESSRPMKRQMENTGSFECGTTSLNTFTHELDDQTSRGEMHIIKDSLLESAGQSDKSSGLYIGEFVDKLQLELTSLDGLDYASKYSPGIQIEEIPSRTSHATTRIQSSLPAAVSEYKGERYAQESARTSTSRTGTKGPSDEMWDVRGLTSQETYRAEEAEEGPIAAEVVDSTTVTEGTETAVAQRSHRSLWTYVADIIKLSWGPHAESPSPTLQYGARSSSNESLSSEAWFSGKEPDDDDEISEKRSGISKESLLIKRPVDESDPRRHAGPSQGHSEVPKFHNRLAMSEAGASTSMGIRQAGSLAQGFSRQVGWTEGEKGRKTIPSNIITAEQSSVLTDDTTPAIIGEEITNIGNVQMPVGRYTKLEEKLVGEESPECKDGELKRRKLQRNKQVLKERFDEWEEAYRLESEQRKTDEFFMREALGEAQKAADTWEVPVGAVLVQNGKIIARGRNLVEELRDSTAHAEMICIREASNILRTWRLAETTLYVTLEPCPMCAGGILQARIDTVVWGAPNKLLGADGSWVRLFPGDGGSSSLDPPNQTSGPVHPFHPKITVRRGVLATECSEVMQQFFQSRRKKNKKPEASPPGPPKLLTKIHDMFSAIFCLQHLN